MIVKSENSILVQQHRYNDRDNSEIALLASVMRSPPYETLVLPPSLVELYDFSLQNYRQNVDLSILFTKYRYANTY